MRCNARQTAAATGADCLRHIGNVFTRKTCSTMFAHVQLAYPINLSESRQHFLVTDDSAFAHK